MKKYEFRDEVRNRIDDPQGVLVTDNELDLWLKLGVQRLWRAWNWPFKRAQTTVVSVANTATIDMPADLQRIKKVVSTTNDTVLVPTFEGRFHAAYPDSPTGQPLWYAEGGLSQVVDTSPPVRLLKLLPTPDAVYSYTVVYSKLLPAWDGDDAYPNVPEDFDEAIIQWALVRFYQKLDDNQNRVACQDAYEDEVRFLTEEYSAGESFHRVPYTLLPE